MNEYRIVDSITGIGWYAVEKWDGYRYKHVASFRAVDLAQEFIEREVTR